jgi:DNA excision repair protein ERCC-5
MDQNLDVSGDVEEENDILDEFFLRLNPGETSREIESELGDLMDKQRREMRDASDVNSFMMSETQELIKLFGLPYMESPSEAESQCAFLVEQDIADGIITDDSDVFLFGGTHVYRHFFDQQKYCELFKADDLKNNMKLDRDRLIRLAYLLGSDYTVGLKGLGPVTSLEILREWDSYGIDGLIQFKEWTKEVQNLKHPRNESGLKIKLVFI